MKQVLLNKDGTVRYIDYGDGLTEYYVYDTHGHLIKIETTYSNGIIETELYA